MADCKRFRVLDAIFENREFPELALLLLDEAVVDLAQRLILEADAVGGHFELADCLFLLAQLVPLLVEGLREGDVGFSYLDVFFVEGVEFSVVGFNHPGDLSLLFFGEAFEALDLFEVVVDGLALSRLGLQVPVFLLCFLLVIFELSDFALVLLDQFLDGVALLVVDGGGQADVALHFLPFLEHFEVDLSAA